MIYTTLNRIRACRPCARGWTKLLEHLGKTAADDDPVGYDVILRSNGLRDALWCMRAEPQHRMLWVKFGLAAARRVQHLMKDQRSIAALDAVQGWIAGDVTDDEVRAARRDAAYAAAYAAYAAAYADAYARTRARQMEEGEQSAAFLEILSSKEAAPSHE